MFLFYIQLAFKSLRKSPLLTVLSVAAIAVGIGVSTSMIAVYRTYSQDPIPEKSERLFSVRMDHWDPQQDYGASCPGCPPKLITYQDMKRIMKSEIPKLQTGVAAATVFVFPPKESSLKSYQVIARLCHSDFFKMFQVPFLYGGAWDKDVDESRAPVCVLSKKGNERLFGGVDSVGKEIRLGTRLFTVVGVLDEFNPTPLYYDVINNRFGEPREIFVPMDMMREKDLGLTQVGDNDRWGPVLFDEAFFASAEDAWIQYWVELESNDATTYKAYIDQYVLDQKKSGRFPRPLNNMVTPMMEWMALNKVTGSETVTILLLSLLFLLVCSLNLMGILLSKYLDATSLLGLHRALGATKAQTFSMNLIECGIVGLLGGLGGFVLSMVALGVLNGLMGAQSMATKADLFRMDLGTTLLALVLSLFAGVLAGLYPAWKACNIEPALQLKLKS